jgi:hypothetical protein
MSYRWYICPVVPRNRPDPEGGDPDTTRVPKVNTHIEPGRGKEYQFWTPMPSVFTCSKPTSRTSLTST